MSSVTKSKTIRHGEMVSPNELELRNTCNNPPPAYTLSTKHKKLIKRYVDNTYTLVELKNGEIVRTRELQQHPIDKRSRASRKSPSNERYFHQISISSLISSRFNYCGLRFKTLAITYGDGYMTIRLKHPENRDYILDCTLDVNAGDFDYTIHWIHNFVSLMIMNHDSMMKGKLSKQAQQAYDALIEGRIIDTRFIIERSAMEFSFGDEIDELVNEIISGGLIDDDENCPIEIDIRTLLNLAKLNNRLANVHTDLRRKYFKVIDERLVRGTALRAYMYWAVCRYIVRQFAPLNKYIMKEYFGSQHTLMLYPHKDCSNASIPVGLKTAILFMEYKLGKYSIPKTLDREVLDLVNQPIPEHLRLKVFLRLMNF